MCEGMWNPYPLLFAGIYSVQPHTHLAIFNLSMVDTFAGTSPRLVVIPTYIVIWTSKDFIKPSKSMVAMQVNSPHFQPA